MFNDLLCLLAEIWSMSSPWKTLGLTYKQRSVTIKNDVIVDEEYESYPNTKEALVRHLMREKTYHTTISSFLAKSMFLCVCVCARAHAVFEASWSLENMSNVF